MLNWKTSLCAVIAAVSEIVDLLLTNSDLVAQLCGPDLAGRLLVAAKVVKAIAIPLGLFLAKDFNVTGGTVPAESPATAIPYVDLSKLPPDRTFNKPNP